MLAALLLGYLVYQAIYGDHSPPNLEVTLREVRASGDDYLVLFEIHNHGGETASNVIVVGHLRRFGITLETAQVTIDYVPAESRREAGLFFETDPRTARLKLMPAGYAKP